jgi:HTH-type transcriptional regulator / antitoxin HigA
MVIEKNYLLDYAVHPGDYLEELLEVHNMSQIELANRTEISKKHINQIINGKASITAKTAVALENITGKPANYWLDLQQRFDEFYERQELVLDLQRHIEWIKVFDYKEISARGYVSQTNDIIQKGLNLLSFFQVSSVDAWHNTWEQNPEEIFCRSGAQTGITVKEKTIARLAQWIRMGQISAEEKVIDYPAFVPDILEKNLKKIRDVNVVKVIGDSIHQLTELLNTAGVYIHFIKEISGMRTYATSFMVRNNEIACIQLSLRGRTNDQLWFSLMHEIYHLLNKGNSKGFLIGHSKNAEEEIQADIFASDILIPKDRYEEFVKSTAFNAQSIMAFATENNVHEGIVVGRLQHDQLIGYNSLNQLKDKYEWVD